MSNFENVVTIVYSIVISLGILALYALAFMFVCNNLVSGFFSFPLSFPESFGIMALAWLLKRI